MLKIHNCHFSPPFLKKYKAIKLTLSFVLVLNVFILLHLDTDDRLTENVRAYFGILTGRLCICSCVLYCKLISLESIIQVMVIVFIGAVLSKLGYMDNDKQKVRLTHIAYHFISDQKTYNNNNNTSGSQNLI